MSSIKAVESRPTRSSPSSRKICVSTLKRGWLEGIPDDLVGALSARSQHEREPGGALFEFPESLVPDPYRRFPQALMLVYTAQFGRARRRVARWTTPGICPCF